MEDSEKILILDASDLFMFNWIKVGSLSRNDEPIGGIIKTLRDLSGFLEEGYSKTLVYWSEKDVDEEKLNQRFRPTMPIFIDPQIDFDWQLENFVNILQNMGIDQFLFSSPRAALSQALKESRTSQVTLISSRASLLEPSDSLTLLDYNSRSVYLSTRDILLGTTKGHSGVPYVGKTKVKFLFEELEKFAPQRFDKINVNLEEFLETIETLSLFVEADTDKRSKLLRKIIERILNHKERLLEERRLLGLPEEPGEVILGNKDKRKLFNQARRLDLFQVLPDFKDKKYEFR